MIGQRDLGKAAWLTPVALTVGTTWCAAQMAPLLDPPAHHTSGSLSPLIPTGGSAVLLALMVLPVTLPVVIALLTALRLTAVLPRRADFHALVHVGATRRSVIRDAWDTGIHAGVRYVGIGMALGAGFRQAYDGITRSVNTSTAWQLCVVLALGVLASGCAHALAAAIVTGPTRTAIPRQPDTVRTSQSASRASATWARHWRRVVWLAAPPAILLITAGVMGRSVGTDDLAPAVTAPLILLYAVSSVATAVEVLVLSVWLLARAAVWLSRRASRPLVSGLAGNVAAEGLQRPLPGRTAAVAGIALAAGCTMAFGTLINANNAHNAAAAALTPSITVWSGGDQPWHVGSTADGPDGWSRAALPQSLADELHAEPGVIVIEAAVLTARDANPSGGEPSYRTALALDAGGLDELGTIATPPPLEGDMTWWFNSGTDGIAVGNVSAQTRTAQVAAPFMAVDRAWAERTFGPASTSALLVYLPASTDAGAFMSQHDLNGIAVRTPEVQMTDTASVRRESMLIWGGGALAGAVGLMVSLSLASQRERAGHMATLAALGAARGVLWRSAALEAGILTLTSAAVGSFAGAMAGAALSASTQVLPGHLWPYAMSFGLTHAPWATVAALIAAGVAISAGAAGYSQLRVGSLSPAEQLREAARGGAR